MLFSLSSFFFLYLGLLALRRDRRSPLNRVFFLVCLSFFLWAFFYSFFFGEPEREKSWVWFRLSSIGFCTFGGVSLHFLVLLAGRRYTLPCYLFSYVPSAIFLLRSWTGTVTAKDFVLSSLGWVEVLDVESPWFISYVSHYCLCVGLGLWLLWRSIRTFAFERQRRQGRIILKTAAVSLFLGSIANIALPSFGVRHLPSVAPILSLIWASGSLYAISKYGLLSLSPEQAVGDVLMNMRDILIMTDVQANIKFVNRALEELTGLKAAQILEKPLSFLVADEEVMEFLRKRGRGFLGKDVEVRAEGNGVPVRISVSPMLDGAGEPFGYAIVGHDLTAERALIRSKEELEERVRERTIELEELTRELFFEIEERKRLEADLKESEERYRTAIENVSDGVAILKGERHIYVNRSFAHIFGYESPYELLGMGLDKLFDGEGLERLRDMVGKKDAVGEFLGEYEFLGRRRDGERIRVEVSGTIISLKGEPYCLLCVRDITERRAEEERLKFLSFHDSQTGLYNRNYFEEEMARMEDGRFDPVGLIVCDLDLLKIVNDTVGHAVGDWLIQEAATLIRGCFRRSDIVARIGGDEFAILLPETPTPYVRRLSERIVARAEERNRENIGLPISLSVGWAVRESPEEAIGQILREADDRMYRKKMQRKESARLNLFEAFKREAMRKDFEERGHLRRMVEVSSSFCSYLQLQEDEREAVRLLALYHDIGKAAISDSIVFKEGPLSEEEKREVERHCEVGQRIAQYVDELLSISDLILMHHERWDGTGYPLHLKGEEIPLACRIISIIDAYEVMTAGRPCRKALKKEESLREIERLKGQKFDPYLVERFVKFIEESNL